MVVHELPLLLVVHQSADLYGSDKVLLLMLKEIVARRIYHPVVVVPESGLLVHALKSVSIEVHVAEVVKVSRSLYTLTGLLGIPARLMKSIYGLDAIVGQRKVAVVHSNTLAVLGGALWAKRRGIRHVWHLHEILLSPAWVGRGLTALVRMLSDAVICNSNKTHDWLLLNQPCLLGRVTVIFNGLPDEVPPSLINVSNFRLITKVGMNDLIVSLVGRISRIKGQGVFIEAAALLRNQYPQLRLKFVMIGEAAPGQEMLFHSLAARVVELGLKDSVIFLPYMSEVNAAWYGTDIAVVPSVEPESFGMVAIEAMAASKPVIASRQGGLLDVIAEGETGLFVEPGNSVDLANAIAKLAADPCLRQRMGKAGRARQQSKFTVRQQVDAALDVYAGVKR